MIESYLWQVVVLLVTCFLHPVAFAASYLLLLTEELQWLTYNEAMFPIVGSLAFPSVTSFTMAAYTTVWIDQGGGLVMTVLVLLIIIPLCCYLFFISNNGGACVNSRRFNQATNAMLLVYAVILCLAAVKLLSFAIPVSVISIAFIFLLSFGLLKKTRMPLFMVLAIGIVIAIFLI